jgi:hypothetical protein
MTETHTTTARPAVDQKDDAEIRTHADLLPLDMLEWLISEAQQAARAAQAYAGRLEVPTDAQFDVLTQLGPALRHLDAAMEALAAHMPTPEPPILPEGVEIGEGA